MRNSNTRMMVYTYILYVAFIIWAILVSVMDISWVFEVPSIALLAIFGYLHGSITEKFEAEQRARRCEKCKNCEKPIDNGENKW